MRVILQKPHYHFFFDCVRDVLIGLIERFVNCIVDLVDILTAFQVISYQTDVMGVD